MDGIAIAWVEFYTADSPGTVRYFTQRWGFTAIAEAELPDRHSTLLRGGDIQLVISRPASVRSPLIDWLARHHGGVADLAFYCQDVPALVARAVLAGMPVCRRAQPGYDWRMSGVIAGPGDMQHTIVEPGSDTATPPPDIPWVPIIDEPPARTHQFRPQAIDHIAFCLPAGHSALFCDLYQEVLSLHEDLRRTVHSGTVALEARVMHDSSHSVTLVMAEALLDSRGGEVEEFCAANGDDGGVHHLGFRSDAVAGHADVQLRHGVRVRPGRQRARSRPSTLLIDEATRVTSLPEPPIESPGSRLTGWETLCCERLEDVTDSVRADTR